MAQLIKKFSPGGVVQLDTAPIKVLGNWYNRDQFRRDALGPRLDKFVKAYDLSPEQAAQLREDVAAHIDEIMDGTMVVTDNNTLENTSGNWENDGVYEKKGLFKWKLSDEEKLNNRSILATNYIINSLNAGAFTKYTSPLKYSLDFDTKFLNKYNSALKPGANMWDDKDFWEHWDNLDLEVEVEKEEGEDKKKKKVKVKERPIKNRLSYLANVLYDEASKIEEDLSYRKTFEWEGWEDNWEGRHLTMVLNLRDAADRLKDGEYTNEDAMFLRGIGVDVDKYLYADKRKKYETPPPPPPTSNEANNLNPGLDQGNVDGTVLGDNPGAVQQTGVTGTNGWKSALNPWDVGTLKLEYNGQLYEGNQIALLEDIPEVQQYLSIVNYDKEGVNPIAKNAGFNYLAYLGDMFELASLGLSVLNTNKYIQDPSIFYESSNGDIVITKDFIFDGKDLLVKTGTDPKSGKPTYGVVGRGYKPNGQLKYTPPKYASKKKITFTDTNKFAEALINTQRNLFDSSIYNEIVKYLQEVVNKFGWDAVVEDSKNRTLRVLYGNHYIYIKLKNGYGKESLTDGSLLEDFWVRNYVLTSKKGGVMKYQVGKPINFTPHVLDVLVEKGMVTKSGGRTNAALGKEARERLMAMGAELEPEDLWRLGNSLVDLSSAVAAFVPGLHLASAATGAAASVSDFMADMSDIADGREGVDFWESAGRLAINLGMDAISLVPALKSVKGASALRKVAQYVPHIAGAIQTYNLIADDDLRESVGFTLGKISKLDIENLNTQDFRNIAYLARTLLAAKLITKGAFSRNKAKVLNTDQVTVKGSVKVNGKSHEITAKVSEALFKSLKKADLVTSAKTALEAEARAKFGSDGNDVKIEDVSVYTTRIGKPITDQVTVVEASPVRTSDGNLNVGKKVFEGWFGSKGLDWKISDYNLSKNTYLGAKIYGNTERAERIGKVLDHRADKTAGLYKSSTKTKTLDTDAPTDKKTTNERTSESTDTSKKDPTPEFIKDPIGFIRPKLNSVVIRTPYGYPAVAHQPAAIKTQKSAAPKIVNLFNAKVAGEAAPKVDGIPVSKPVITESQIRKLNLQAKWASRDVKVSLVRKDIKRYAFLRRLLGPNPSNARIKENFPDLLTYNEWMASHMRTNRKGKVPGREGGWTREDDNLIYSRKRGERYKAIDDKKEAQAALKLKQLNKQRKAEKLENKSKVRLEARSAFLTRVDLSKQQLNKIIGKESYNKLTKELQRDLIRSGKISGKKTEELHESYGKYLTSGYSPKKLKESFNKYGIDNPYKLFGGVLSPYLIKKLQNSGIIENVEVNNEVDQNQLMNLKRALQHKKGLLAQLQPTDALYEILLGEVQEDELIIKELEKSIQPTELPEELTVEDAIKQVQAYDKVVNKYSGETRLELLETANEAKSEYINSLPVEIQTQVFDYLESLAQKGTVANEVEVIEKAPLLPNSAKLDVELPTPVEGSTTLPLTPVVESSVETSPEKEVLPQQELTTIQPLLSGNWSETSFSRKKNGTYTYKNKGLRLTVGPGIIPEGYSEESYSFGNDANYDEKTGILTAGGKKYYNIDGTITSVPEAASKYLIKGDGTTAGMANFTINPNLLRYMELGKYGLTDLTDDKKAFKWEEEMKMHDFITSGKYSNFLKELYDTYKKTNPDGTLEDFIADLNAKGNTFRSEKVDYYDLSENDRKNRTITFGEGNYAKSYWIDHEGKLLLKPVKSEKTSFFNNLKTKINSSWPQLHDWGRLAVGAASNFGYAKYANEKLLNHLDTPKTLVPLRMEDDYLGVAKADREAGNSASLAAQGGYSDARMNNALMYSANKIGVDAKMKANELNAKTVDASVSNISKLNLAYRDAATATLNKNGEDSTSFYNSLHKNVFGAIEHAIGSLNKKLETDQKYLNINEARTNEAKLQAETLDIQTAVDSEAAALLIARFGSQALLWYKTKVDPNQEYVTESIIDNYITAHPEVTREANRLKNRIMANYNKRKLLALLKYGLYPTNIFSISLYGIDPYTLEPIDYYSSDNSIISAKSGSRLTMSDMTKLDNVRKLSKKLKADDKRTRRLINLNIKKLKKASSMN